MEGMKECFLALSQAGLSASAKLLLSVVEDISDQCWCPGHWAFAPILVQNSGKGDSTGIDVCDYDTYLK